jgi:hypothetical protein
VHRLALDRAGPDECDLNGDVVEVRRLRSQETLHLGAALDLEGADRVRTLDVVVHRRVVEGDAREVDHLAVRTCDLVDAVLDCREHPQPEEVDLEEPRVGARVLVPLAELTPGHRGRLHRDEVDQRPRRDDHPAGVLRDVTREPGDLAGQPRECAPPLRLELAVSVGESRNLLPHTLRIPSVRGAGQALELCERKAERLPDVADRASRAVRGEARDERRMLATVAPGDPDDELLADVAREVEVDVRHGGQLAVQEAPERELVRDGIDVREPREVADDRPDRTSPPTSRRQEATGRVAPPHLVRALARDLEHLVVEQEEPGEPELLDELELALEASTCAAL